MSLSLSLYLSVCLSICLPPPPSLSPTPIFSSLPSTNPRKQNHMLILPQSGWSTAVSRPDVCSVYASKARKLGRFHENLSVLLSCTKFAI